MTVTAVRDPDTSGLELRELDDAHAAAAAALAGMPPHARAVAEAWLRDQLVAALASIRPAWFAGSHPPLVPVPRGYLSTDQQARIAGVRSALHHVEARQVHHAHGDRPLVDASTPFVLNALAEGRRDRDEPSDPGLVRATETRWNVRDHPYHHPPAEDCPGLMDATLRRLPTLAHLHPVVQGAWLAFSWMSIHPFVDGNGRTARLLHLLVSGPGLAAGQDLGVAEQWVFHRHRYQQALSMGQKVARGFDVSRLDPDPFVAATVAWSAAGAGLTRRRAETVATMWDSLAPLDDHARTAVVTVALRHMASPSDVPAAVGPYEDRLAVLVRLAADGVIRRVALPPSRQVVGAPPRPHYALDQHVAQRLRTTLAQA